LNCFTVVVVDFDAAALVASPAFALELDATAAGESTKKY